MKYNKTIIYTSFSRSDPFSLPSPCHFDRPSFHHRSHWISSGIASNSITRIHFRHIDRLCARARSNRPYITPALSSDVFTPRLLILKKRPIQAEIQNTSRHNAKHSLHANRQECHRMHPLAFLCFMHSKALRRQIKVAVTIPSPKDHISSL